MMKHEAKPPISPSHSLSKFSFVDKFQSFLTSDSAASTRLSNEVAFTIKMQLCSKGERRKLFKVVVTKSNRQSKALRGNKIISNFTSRGGEDVNDDDEIVK